MTNLTSTKETVQKLLIPIVVSIIVIILISLILFRYKGKIVQTPSQTFPPSPPTIKQDPKQKQPAAIDVSKLTSQKFPEILPIYSQASYQDFTQDQAQSIANVLDITAFPFLVDKNTLEGTQYTWQQENLSLTLSKIDLDYTNANKTNNAPLPENQIQAIAKNFIEKIPVSSKDLEINLTKTVYLKKTANLPISTGSFAEADFEEYHFEKKLEGLPLLPNNPNSSTAVIRLDKNGNIIRLNLRILTELTEKDSYRLKNLSEAEKALMSNQGKIVQTYLLDENGKAIELFRTLPVNIKALTITNIYLAYYEPESSEQLIQPIFVFEGEFTKDNQKGKAVIYLPAL